MQQPAKQLIRKNTLALRERLSADARAALSAAITERLLQLPAYRQAGAVMGYMNIGTEFASELWVGQALADGKQLALPRVNHHTDQLDLYWVKDMENQLAAGLWGVREPIPECCERLESLDEVEFILLPGVAFDRNGARLGYGKGFYDKLLSTLIGKEDADRPVLAAAAFAQQVIEHVPQEPTDVKVEWIITELETIACANNE